MRRNWSRNSSIDALKRNPKILERWRNRFQYYEKPEGALDNEVYIYGPIIPDDEANLWHEWFGDTVHSSPAAIRRQIADSKGDLVLHVNSPGGSVPDASAIRQQLQGHIQKGRCVMGLVDGLCASAAVLPFLSCDKRQMVDTAEMFIHEVRAPIGLFIYGTADELDKEALALQSEAEGVRKLNETIASVYAQESRNGAITAQSALSMMQDDTYITPQEAVDFGWSDSIFTANAEKKENLDMDTKKIASLLGLPDQATEEDIEKAIKAQDVKPKQDASQVRIAALLGLGAEASQLDIETAIAERDAQGADADFAAMLNGHVERGAITPQVADTYRENFKQSADKRVELLNVNKVLTALPDKTASPVGGAIGHGERLPGAEEDLGGKGQTFEQSVKEKVDKGQSIQKAITETYRELGAEAYNAYKSTEWTQKDAGKVRL